MLALPALVPQNQLDLLPHQQIGTHNTTAGKLPPVKLSMLQAEHDGIHVA